MRVVITGKKAFGAAIFDLCQERGDEIIAVWAPAFTDDGGRRDRLRVKAETAGVPWHPAGSLSNANFPEGVEVLLAAHSTDFVSRPVRLACSVGALGYHPSLLPLHRGRDAVRWAIKMGERVTGGTVYWLNDNIDAGDIAAQDFCFIRERDTAEELWRRELFPLGVRLFELVLKRLDSGLIVAISQDQALATWEPSWQRPPVHRPDLLMIGSGLDAYQVKKTR